MAIRLIDLETPEIPAAQPIDTSAMAQDMGQVAGPWAGKPGQFSNKGSIQNGLDALNKAGASVPGFLGKNRNDIELVQKFYSTNPEVANQYDLPVNLFLRYVSGVGDKGLRVSREQGTKMLSAITEAKRTAKDLLKPDALSALTPEYQKSMRAKIGKGLIPVGIGGSLATGGNEIINSMGRFWAEPQKDGSYRVVEDFNFAYAPSSKGGNDTRASLVRNPLASLTINPADQGRQIVASGVGQPFRYTLIVKPDGSVQVMPKSLSSLAIKKR
jgi:hypothetical protein